MTPNSHLLSTRHLVRDASVLSAINTARLSVGFYPTVSLHDNAEKKITLTPEKNRTISILSDYDLFVKDEFGLISACTLPRTSCLGTGRLGTGRLGTGRLGTRHLGTRHLGTGHLGTGHLGTGHLGTGHLGTNLQKFNRILERKK